jgi:chromosome segregation ATPase
MVLRSIVALSAAVLVGSMVGAGAGCSGGRVARSESATSEMAATSEYIGKINSSIDLTVTSLNDVLASADTDPRDAYKKFSDNVDKLSERRDVGKSRYEDMKQALSKHYAEWEKEIATLSNPDMQERGRERLTKAREELTKIGAKVDEARAAYEPFMATLKDLQVYLGNDLNPAGIKSVEDQIKRAGKEGEKLKEKVTEASEEIEKLRKSMAARQADKAAETAEPAK